ncbi:MAG: hypothetical protein PUE43_01570 [Clostridium sp.]|nr:hypothetical protein [Clostridium sp.]
MKEATGELNMTVVTIVAIAAVALLFYAFLWPVIQKSIVTQTCKTYGADWKAIKVDNTTIDTGSQATVKKWACCPKGTNRYDATKCQSADN